MTFHQRAPMFFHQCAPQVITFVELVMFWKASSITASVPSSLWDSGLEDVGVNHMREMSCNHNTALLDVSTYQAPIIWRLVYQKSQREPIGFAAASDRIVGKRADILRLLTL